jgi:hypothetical protein
MVDTSTKLCLLKPVFSLIKSKKFQDFNLANFWQNWHCLPLRQRVSNHSSLISYQGYTVKWKNSGLKENLSIVDLTQKYPNCPPQAYQNDRVLVKLRISHTLTITSVTSKCYCCICQWDALDWSNLQYELHAISISFKKFLFPYLSPISLPPPVTPSWLAI